MAEHGSAARFRDKIRSVSNVAMTGPLGRSVVVLETRPVLSASLSMLCTALELDLVRVRSHHDLPLMLHRHRPMALIAVVEGTGQGCSNALRSLAAFDADLPVLLIAGDDPAAQGAIDATEQLWGLTGIRRVSDPPAPQDVMGFLFLAGRRSGAGRLIPVS